MIPISICIITKNEEEHLENCLKAIRASFQVPIGALPLPHEIVVTDTGSTDRTKEIAHAYADTVTDFKWINDFSAARNDCIRHAKHEYILSLDADEYITSADWYEIDRQISLHPDGIGSFMLNNDQKLDSEEDSFSTRVVRFFSSHKYHFEGSVHEQIRPLPDMAALLAMEPNPSTALKDKIYTLPLVARHVGYVGDAAYLEQKAKRDLVLILEELNKNPANPYFLFQAGECYNLMNQYEQALTFYEKALLFDLDPSETYVQVLINSYGHCLLYLNRYEEALQLEGIYDDFATNADFVILMGTIYAHNKLYMKALAEFVKALSFSDNETYIQSANKQIAHYNIGYIYEIFGEKDMAITQYRMCGDYPIALERLKELT